MKYHLSRLTVFAVIAFYCVFRSNCLAYSIDQKSLKVGITRIHSSFDPAYVQSMIPATILHSIHRTLVKVGSFGRISSDIASSWRINSDHTSFKFCVEGEYFNDGKIVSFEDIAYSIERIKRTGDDSYIKRIFFELDPIAKMTSKSIETQGPSSFCFDIVLKTSFPDFLYFLATPHLAIVPNGSKPTSSIGSGRFVVSKFDHESRKFMELVCVKQCDSIPINKITFTEMAYNPKEVERRILSGEIDMFLGVGDYRDLPSTSDRLKVTYLDALSVSHLFFNLKKPVFQNKEFRRDLSFLIQGVVRKNTLKQKVPFEFLASFIPKGIFPAWYYKNPDFEKFDLDSFGEKWRGKVQIKEIKIVGTINQFDQRIVKDLSYHLAKVGVRLEYVSDFYGASKRLIEIGDFDLRFSGWTGLYEKPESFVFMLDTKTFKDSPANGITQKLFEQIKLLRKDPELASRQTQLAKLIKDIESEHIFVPLFRSRMPVIHSERINLPSTKFKDGIDFQNIQIIEVRQ